MGSSCRCICVSDSIVLSNTGLHPSDYLATTDFHYGNFEKKFARTLSLIENDWININGILCSNTVSITTNQFDEKHVFETNSNDLEI